VLARPRVRVGERVQQPRRRRDPVDEPKRRRVRPNRPEQRVLIAQRTDVGETISASAMIMVSM
jgi:hypothetical protein